MSTPERLTPNNEGNPPFSGRTYLYIRKFHGDRGYEPGLVGSSPDIVVRYPESNGLPPWSWDPHEIQVTIRNGGGIDAVDAYVDLVWHAIYREASGLQGSVRRTLSGKYTTIPGYGENTVEFQSRPPYFPGTPSEVYTYRLLARVSLIIPPDTYRPGVYMTSDDIALDRHVAEHSLRLINRSSATDFTDIPIAVLRPTSTVIKVSVSEVPPPYSAELGTLVGIRERPFSKQRLQAYGIVSMKTSGLQKEVLVETSESNVSEIVVRIYPPPSSGLHVLKIEQHDTLEKSLIISTLVVIL
jgi:hypothetical protein